MLVKTLEYF